MTHDHGQPPDVEDAIVEWMSFLGASAAERTAGEALPFWLVTKVAGYDDKVWEYSTVDVDTFASDRNSASIYSRLGHRRMLSLLPDDLILLPDGSTATVDRIKTVVSPRYVKSDPDTGRAWDADVDRYTTRYEVMTRFVFDGGS